MEKWVVRKAFEDMLPESVTWRQKEQFSDGVGYSWIDTLKDLVDVEVTDEQMGIFSKILHVLYRKHLMASHGQLRKRHSKPLG